MLKQVLSLDFFKVETENDDDDPEAECYDFNKVVHFCLLFSDETPENKVTCLFYLICNNQSLITSRNS